MYFRYQDQKALLFASLFGLLCLWTLRFQTVSIPVSFPETSENTAVSGLYHVGVELVSQNDSFLFQVDINTADWSEFALLPGIGEVLSRRIVESREQEGLFQSPKEIIRVKGIGEKKFQKIAPYLIIRDVQEANSKK